MHKSGDSNLLPQRRSIRLKGYDYSRPGYYFITLCVQDKLHLFGNISNEDIGLSDVGKMIVKWWLELNNKFDNIKLHEFVVMPNHLHGIIQITYGADSAKGGHIGSTGGHAGATGGHAGATGGHAGATGGHTGPPLHDMVRWFKTMTTNEYIRNVKQNGWQQFDGRLWQRNFWEHIIRNNKSLRKTIDYILTNPLQWLDDEYYS